MIVDPFPMQELLSSRLMRRNMPLIDQKLLVITGKGKSKDDPKVSVTFSSTDISVITISSSMH